MGERQITENEKFLQKLTRDQPMLARASFLAIFLLLEWASI
jgi:hypothetical protein